MGNARKGLATLAVIVVLVAASLAVWPLIQNLRRTPGCTVTAAADAASVSPVEFALTGEQADNAATIAAIGIKLGMPDHAVSIALATALQESGLRNLAGGIGTPRDCSSNDPAKAGEHTRRSSTRSTHPPLSTSGFALNPGGLS